MDESRPNYACASSGGRTDSCLDTSTALVMSPLQQEIRRRASMHKWCPTGRNGLGLRKPTQGLPTEMEMHCCFHSSNFCIEIICGFETD